MKMFLLSWHEEKTTVKGGIVNRQVIHKNMFSKKIKKVSYIGRVGEELIKIKEEILEELPSVDNARL